MKTEHMKKDIPNLKVKDVAIAIVPRKEDEELWDSFLINFKNEPLENVLVNSRGYGELEGREVKTTVLRHFFDSIQPKSFTQIEPIQTKLFGITNEYWVSFSFEEHMYDKKYVFVSGSISETLFTTIPFLNKRGVMIR